MSGRTEHQRVDGMDHFRDLFVLIPTPVVVATARGQVAESNEAFAELVGHTRDSLPGRQLSDVGISLPLAMVGTIRPPGVAVAVEVRLRIGSDPGRALGGTLAWVTWKRAPHVVLTLAPEPGATGGEIERARARIRTLTSRLIDFEENERERLSREFHDQLGQQMTVLRMTLGGLGRAVGDEPLLLDCIQLTEGLIEQVRTLSFELRPRMLDQLGLSAAIRAYAERRADQAGIGLRVSTDETALAFAGSVQTAFFRILQEAINNVVRHASAETLSVRLRVRGDGVTLTVEDDGRGFVRSELGSTTGLEIMEERAVAAGARLSISSEPGGGTKVEVTYFGDGAWSERP